VSFEPGKFLTPSGSEALCNNVLETCRIRVTSSANVISAVFGVSTTLLDEGDFIAPIGGCFAMAGNGGEDLAHRHCRHKFLRKVSRLAPLPLMGSTRGEPSGWRSVYRAASC